MAVDTRDKRASALQYQSAGLMLFPNPDGSLATVTDRQHVAHFYAVELAATIVPATFVCMENETLYIANATGTLFTADATGTLEVC